MTMFADKDTILDTMGQFTWTFDYRFFVETELGNFIWKDPSYEGDNTFTLYNGSWDQYRKEHNIDVGRDKGLNLIRNKCGPDIKLVIPQE